ncbi:MAG TPA: aldehyde dehydrogenase family protein, partial [Pyrinomonadaceae bacterium]|nr:aldehyde dehydrogenase family protein [Pyrinomonadaceae bacterium]
MPISSINPATAEVLQTFDPLTQTELDQKMNRAAEAFREHRRPSFADRARFMQRAAEILDAEKKSFARTMTLEMGKPISAAVQEAEKCAWVCRYYAENAERHLADEIVETNATESFVRYQPLGVVLAVMPWN